MGNTDVSKKKGRENKWKYFGLTPEIVTEEDRLQSFFPFLLSQMGVAFLFFSFVPNQLPA